MENFAKLRGRAFLFLRAPISRLNSSSMCSVRAASVIRNFPEPDFRLFRHPATIVSE